MRNPWTRRRLHPGSSTANMRHPFSSLPCILLASFSARQAYALVEYIDVCNEIKTSVSNASAVFFPGTSSCLDFYGLVLMDERIYRFVHLFERHRALGGFVEGARGVLRRARHRC